MRIARILLPAILVAICCSQAHAQDITTGLIGHWRLVETSGTVANDLSSNNNDGTYTNGVALATSTACPVDGSISAKFDGANDYVAIPNESLYDVTGAMTVAIWIRVDVFDTAWQTFISKGDGNGWRLLRNNTTNTVTFAVEGTTPEWRVDSVSSVNDGQWHHLCAVYTGSQIRLYIDGVLEDTATASGSQTLSNYAVNIGRNSELSGVEFDGALYDARIYNRGLSPDDVAYLYTLGGPIGHWRLNQTSGTVATDSSVNQNNGTYTNGPVLNQAGPYPGPGEKAPTFDGVNDNVTIPNESLYDITSKITVAAWIRVNAFTLNNQAIIAKGNTSWRMQRDFLTNKVHFALSGLTDSSVVTVSDVNDGKWHHIAATYDGSNYRIYFDGVLEDTDPATGSISTNNYAVIIGDNLESGSRTWNGWIQDVRVYIRALSTSEIGELAGKVGHWKLADASGTTAVDSSPFVKNGTVTGGASWSTRCNGAGVFNFNGTTHYISTTNASQLQPETGIAVAAWIKGDTWGTGSDVDVILRKGEASPSNYQFCITGGRVTLQLDDSDGVGYQGNTVLNTGQWYHVAATWDGSTVKIFVDGQLDNTPVARTGTILTDTRPLYIGGRSGADLFDGMIYDVRFYNRAIYPSEIAELYGLIGYWKLDESSGTVAADFSGLGNTGTVAGTVNWFSGVINNCQQFNGSTTKINVTGLMNRPKNCTLAAWTYLFARDSLGAEAISIGNYAVLRLDNGTVTGGYFWNGSAFISVTVTQTFAGTGWQHFAVVFDDDQNVMRLYRNGVEIANASTTASITYTGQGSGTVFGSHGNAATQYDFNGRLDDVRIYNRALCPDEILAIKNLGVIPGVRVVKWLEIP